jgi:hypothetical protein
MDEGENVHTVHPIGIGVCVCGDKRAQVRRPALSGLCHCNFLRCIFSLTANLSAYTFIRHAEHFHVSVVGEVSINYHEKPTGFVWLISH